MKNRTISKITAAAISTAMIAVLATGCGAAGNLKETSSGADEEAETADIAETADSTESAAVYEDAGEDGESSTQDGFIFGKYWGISFDPNAFVTSQDNETTTVSYTNDPAGSAFLLFTETEYKSTDECIDALSKTTELNGISDLTINGDYALYASVNTSGSDQSSLAFSDEYYVVDVSGRILQIEEFVTLTGDEEEDNEIHDAMFDIIANNMDFDEDTETPDNFMEERVGKCSFDSQEEIIDSLEAGEGYAYVNVMGMDEPVLVITNDMFTPDDDTANCLSCYPYYKAATGKYICGSVFSTISTATPIAVSDDGVVYCATHNSMTKLVFDEDGRAIMALEYAYVDWAQDDTLADTYGGFVNDTNSFSSPETMISETDGSYFENAFEEYDTLTPINFTVVE